MAATTRDSTSEWCCGHGIFAEMLMGLQSDGNAFKGTPALSCLSCTTRFPISIGHDQMNKTGSLLRVSVELTVKRYGHLQPGANRKFVHNLPGSKSASQAHPTQETAVFRCLVISTKSVTEGNCCLERETGFEPATSTLAIPFITLIALILLDLRAQKCDNSRKNERKSAPQAHPKES
jgi:hypothetical protein